MCRERNAAYDIGFNEHPGVLSIVLRDIFRQRGTVLSESVLVLGTRIVALCLGMIATVFVFRVGSEEVWGNLAFQIAILTTASIGAIFGMDTLTSRYTALSDIREGQRFRVHCTKLILILSVPIVALVLIVWHLAGSLSYEASAVVAGLPFFAILRLHSGYWIGAGRPVLAAVLTNLATLGFFVIGLLLLWAVSNVGFTRATTTTAYLLGLIAASAIAFLTTRPSDRPTRSAPTTELAFRKTLGKARPFAVVASTAVIIYNSDLLVLGALEDDLAVSQYDVAFRLAGLVGLVLGAINPPSTRRFAALAAQQDYVQLAQFYRKVCLISTAGAVALGAAVVVVSSFWIDDLLDADVVMPVLILLILSQVYSAAVGPVANVLQMAGFERKFQWVFGQAAVLNLVLNLALTPSFGAVGAAIGSLVAVAYWNTGGMYLTLKNLGFGSLFTRNGSMQNDAL